MKTLIAALMVVALGVATGNATPIDFGTMTLDGDNGDGDWHTSDGWDFIPYGSGGDRVGTKEATFWTNGTGAGLGTSDGDLLAAGGYNIAFVYRQDYTPAQLTAEAFAWDGSTQTLLSSSTPTMGLHVWNPGSLSFSIASGSPVIGQQLQVKFSNTGGGGYLSWDTISGEFTAVPEPASLAILGLGGLLLAIRRRKC